jgi:hypothetical protein
MMTMPVSCLWSGSGTPCRNLAQPLRHAHALEIAGDVGAAFELDVKVLLNVHGGVCGFTKS